jgi:integrase
MPRQAQGPTLRANPKKGGVYYIYWTDPVTGRSREQSTSTRDQTHAAGLFAEWLARYSHTEWTGPRRASEVKIIDCLRLYAEEHVKNNIPSKAGRATAAQAIVTLEKWWSDRTLDYVKPQTCRAYGRDRNVAYSTVARELIVLRAAINYAHKNGRLVEPPFVEVPSLNLQPPPRDRWLTRSEVARLLWESRRYNDHLARFCMLVLRTGQRPGAVLDLRWPQVDFDNNCIDFNPPGTARSNKKRAIVVIPRRLRWWLLRWQARATSPYVVAHDGQQIKSAKIAFRKARKRAGLGPEVVPYTLRHTNATWRAQAGVDLIEIGGSMGHSNPKTTWRYAHHSPDYMARSKKVMD